jgi:uncharacterized membrane protein YccC
MALSDRFKYSFKVALAMVIAYGVALSMNWEKPMWAGFAVAFISLATVGQSLNKGVMRMLGTLVGAVFALALIALFPQERWWFMIGLSAFVGLCTYLIGGSERQYVWNVAGFVSVIICMESAQAAGQAFDIAVLRTLETGLGILSYTLVTVLLWPASAADDLDTPGRRLVSTQHALYLRYLELLAGDEAAEDTHALRMQGLQQFNQFSQALAGARASSYAVWEARREWARFHASLRQVGETLERWRESFSEVRDLDLKLLMSDLQDFAEELDARFAQIERMLEGQAPERFPKPLKLPLNMDAVGPLSHFEKAALAVSRAQLRRLESLTRALFDTLADIKDLVPSRRNEAELVTPTTAAGLDVERLGAAVRVMAGLWIAYLLWLYLEVPGGVGVVILSGSLGMALATNAQIPMHLVFKPLAVSFVFASILYMFLMPQLSSFAELGFLIFAVTFAICFLFYAPQHMLGRVAGLVMFLMIAGISNQQSYNFLSLANTALMFPVVFAALALAAHIPASSKPERAFLRLLRRFLRSCAYMTTTPVRDPGRTPRRLDRWRQVFHARQIATLPQRLVLWARAVDRRRLPGSTADQLQSLTVDIQGLSYGMQEILEARAANRSALIAQVLSREIDTWRAGLQQVFGTLASDPATVDHEGFRAQLDAKLERLEERLEKELDKAELAGVSTAQAEESYRLLGAHRRLSEAVINLSQRVGVIDWPRLRESRF